MQLSKYLPNLMGIYYKSTKYVYISNVMIWYSSIIVINISYFINIKLCLGTYLIRRNRYNYNSGINFMIKSAQQAVILTSLIFYVFKIGT